MFNEQLKHFADTHPDLFLVRDSVYSEDLLWADEKKYIQLVRFEDEAFYTDLQLETARMWREKEELPSTPKDLILYVNNRRIASYSSRDELLAEVSHQLASGIESKNIYIHQATRDA